MLHDSHQLDSVVPKVGNAREHVGCEVFVGVHLLLRRGYAHVTLIHTGTCRLGWPSVFHDVPLIRGRVPELLAECYSFRVLLVLGWLDYIAGPGGDSVFTIHKDFYLEIQ